MALDICANCGEPITLTRVACDHCGWIPASKKAQTALEEKKEECRVRQRAFEDGGQWGPVARERVLKRNED